MIDNRLTAAATAEAVVRNTRRGTRPKTHVTNDDIVCIKHHLMVANTDAVTGRRLPRDCNKRIRDFYSRLQWNRSGHAKDDYPRSFGCTRLTKTAWPAIVKISDLDDASAASA